MGVHLGKVKWGGIFNLLPSEERSKLSEREVNLVEMAIAMQGENQPQTRCILNNHLLYFPVVEGVKEELVLIGVEERQVKLVAVRQNHLTVSIHLIISTLY